MTEYFSEITPDVSIVIVTYNNENCIEACLASIYDSFPASKVEIIVVDNCSIDNGVALVQEKYERVKVVSNKENVGFAAAVNQGMRVAASDIIILLNSDVIVNKKALEGMLAACKSSGNLHIFSPLVFNMDGSFQDTSIGMFPSCPVLLVDSLLSYQMAKTFGLKTMFGNADKENTHQYEWVSGACMAFRREVVQKIGQFDDAFFMYFEDVDFCKRAAHSGIASTLLEDISVLHIGGKSFDFKKGHNVRNKYVRKSRLAYIRKHESAPKVFLLKISFYVGDMLRLIQQRFAVRLAKDK
jgi:N-acetylglucosaminyl-diphospho-decaprenol L-rhamnosyltransferase